MIGNVRKEYVCVKCAKVYCNKSTLITHSKSCTGDMCNTAPIDISDKEPEGVETEVCYNTADQLSGPTHAGDKDPMNQMSGYLVSTMETTLQVSQELPANMSDSQSSEVTQGQLELNLEPEVTVF